MAKSIRDDLENAFDAMGESGAFQAAYGRFMMAWADTELELYRVLVNYSGVSDAVARAIFSGTRANVMMDFIRGIAHNTELSKERIDDLEHAFKQMAVINGTRDLLAHNLLGIPILADDPKERIVTNSPRVSRYGRQKTHRVSAKTLDEMTWDLYGIANHLNMHWGPRDGPFRPWREQNEDDPPTTWLYKSQQQANTPDTNPSTRRLRKARRQSSR